MSCIIIITVPINCSSLCYFRRNRRSLTAFVKRNRTTETVQVFILCINVSKSSGELGGGARFATAQNAILFVNVIKTNCSYYKIPF